jgi:hypothetical protein
MAFQYLIVTSMYVRIRGHFAILDERDFTFYRHPIATFDMYLNGRSNVEGIHFCPEHWNLIRSFSKAVSTNIDK